MEKKEHPHAQVLRWVADGEKVQGRYGSETCWHAFEADDVLGKIGDGSAGRWQFRIKPTPMCELAGIRFPVPMREAPKDGTEIWVAAPEGAFRITWYEGPDHRKCLSANLCHAAEEAAKAHSEALRKVNLMAIEGAK